MCHMGYEISYAFKVWKPLWALGSLKTPNTVNVSILGNGSKVNGKRLLTILPKLKFGNHD